MSELNLTFETNEGVTVLPVTIPSGENAPLVNPYKHFRHLLVLPKGATGVKSCKITLKDMDYEVQHNFTFGIMPPPYNYDNVLFGFLMGNSIKMGERMEEALSNLNVVGKFDYENIKLPKSQGKQTISIEYCQLFFRVLFSYPLSPEPTIHKPKITLRDTYNEHVYTLSLNKTANMVLIDLLTGMITAYDKVNGEIIQQSMIDDTINAFESISFENFDDINTQYLTVRPMGVYVR